MSLCKISKGELFISRLLDDNKISYKKQKTFKDCINPKTNCRLKYDFYLPKYNILIEYNGKQHYCIVGFWKQSTELLKNMQYRDNLKKKYAINNGYKFLVIKYDENIKKTIKKAIPECV